MVRDLNNRKLKAKLAGEKGGGIKETFSRGMRPGRRDRKSRSLSTVGKRVIQNGFKTREADSRTEKKKGGRKTKDSHPTASKCCINRTVDQGQGRQEIHLLHFFLSSSKKREEGSV